MDLHALDDALTRLADGTSTEVDVAVLLHDLQAPQVRDAVLAAATGYVDAARAILRAKTADTSWLVDGPLDGAAITRAMPLLRRIHEDARLAHSPATADAAAVVAYLEWASGHPIRALQMLREHPGHRLGGMLRARIALGTPAPAVLTPVPGVGAGR